jgi:hypothetical protein
MPSIGIETQLPPTIFTLAFLITYITAPSPAYIGFFVYVLSHLTLIACTDP